jgi:hypothetical protein
MNEDGYAFKKQWQYLILSTFTLNVLLAIMPYHASPMAIQEPQALRKRINFIAKGKQRTPNPPGWEAYDGSIYTKERGYGWLTDLSERGWDRGDNGEIILPDGTRASPRTLSRLELANWQGTHQESRLLVFRVDLPDGWYRITCTSVDPFTPLPQADPRYNLEGKRSIKFRAHDVIFAGATYGEPLKVEATQLVEGTGIVEVTEGHLRIVVGDPAYAGWTWSYRGPWHRGWGMWFGENNLQRYAESWYQKLTRTVDPGYHNLRFNALEIERVAAPTKRSPILFRDFFNRDDSSDVNSGLTKATHWLRVKLHPVYPGRISSELHKTSLKLTGPHKGTSVVGFVQQKTSPERGTILYSTRVSLFTGAGSQQHSGVQEAGLLILSGPDEMTEFNATFIGVAYDRSRLDTPGWVRYRVGNGRDGYRTNSEVPDTKFPFKVTAGEYEVIVVHDIGSNTLTQIRINGEDITGYWPPSDRQQRVSQGVFGIRALMDAHGSGVRLQQYYWCYRVEDAASRDYMTSAGINLGSTMR